MPVDPVTPAPAIRTCSTADAPVLALIGSATLLDTYAGRLPGPAVLAHCFGNHTPAAWTALLEAGKSQVWIAETAGAPIGYAALTLPDFPEFAVQPGDLELKRIYVLSRFHSTGLGRQLMNLALKAAANQGAGRVLIGVHRENARALAFYRRNGFTPAGTRTFHLGPEVFNDLILARQLREETSEQSLL